MNKTRLILSIFPGIDMLGMAFERSGFCVVRGPDLITGGDIRSFWVPSALFAGVIGGPPCQDFSRLNRNPGNYSHAMLEEFKRIICEAQPEWFLFENVATAPDFQIEGYAQQRFDLDLAWFSEFSRLRHFVFGSKSGVLLDPMKGTKSEVLGGAVTGSDLRSFQACCDIQGLPRGFDLPSFTLEGKKLAIANGVPLQMGRYVAELISSTLYNETAKQAPASANLKRCACGCGRAVVGRSTYRTATCRKRAQRKREALKLTN